MNTLEAIAARRSIRRYQSEPVPEPAITAVLEAARLAPSGTNHQARGFLVVRRAETRRALCEAAYNQRFVAEAPVVIVCLGNRKLFRKRLRRGKELVEIGAVDRQTMATVGEAYRRRDDAAEAADHNLALNCAIAVDHMTLAAVDQGLGTCWVMLFEGAQVREICGLPKHLVPVALLPLGYPAEEPAPRPRYALPEIAWDEDLDHPWRAGETSGGPATA
jgi:nitroreductase